MVVKKSQQQQNKKQDSITNSCTYKWDHLCTPGEERKYIQDRAKGTERRIFTDRILSAFAYWVVSMLLRLQNKFYLIF